MPGNESGAPDNRAAWNTISAAAQARYGQGQPLDRFYWCWGGPSEDELQLLGDIEGKRALVLGCGGGQDCIALIRMGAAEVTGIDLSDEQIRHARHLADREGVRVRLLQGDVEDLSAIDGESQDLIVSSLVLTQVQRINRCFAESGRVLRPGGLFAFSIHHPFDACTDDQPPYGILRSYWQEELAYEWEDPETGLKARFLNWYRPLSEWYRLLTDTGFQVERILEPRLGAPPAWAKPAAWEEGRNPDKRKLIPDTLVFKARKPG